MSSSTMPRVVSAGVPIRSPEGFIGGRSSNGIALRLTVIPTCSSRCSAVLPSRPVGPRSTSTRCTSVPPVSTSTPFAISSSANARALAIVCRWRARKGSDWAIPSATALAAMMCISGPPCWPGKIARLISVASSSSLVRIIPLRGPQSVLWTVVVVTCACSTGFGCSPAATRPAKWAMSTISFASTESAISRKAAKSSWRG